MTDQPVRSNTPEFSVSELALSLKKTLEDGYGRVRVRGELSKVKIHTSGHMYSDLKDEAALINVVCWRGTLGGLSVRPEEGLEVICTGRITTYPARSNYQLVIEKMELAGQGALLKMLEERRKKLTAEGLFDPARKRALPFIPQRIGVITSPTGAVIRDILHRLADRFPRPVLLWSVAVQGTGAAEQIAAAIAGFNALPDHQRPDLLIVARGGGSLEDLMAFNEEAVVRAAAASAIPLISAVGHETDTTLIDFAADIRAPTPTAAAEMAVPVRLNLLAQVQDDGHRLLQALARTHDGAHDRLRQRAPRLCPPARLLELKTQALDHTGDRLAGVFERYLSRKREGLVRAQAQLAVPQRRIAEAQRILGIRAEALARAGGRTLDKPAQRLQENVRLLESFSFRNVLTRGFVLLQDERGKPLTSAGKLRIGQKIALTLADGRAKATIDNIEGTP